jgi:hypothetical protein
MALNELSGAIARFSANSAYSVEMDDIVAPVVLGRYSVSFARYLNHGKEYIERKTKLLTKREQNRGKR